MTATYDLTTDIGKVRLMIPDRDLSNAMFQDDEIEALLAMEQSSAKRATALALETIAVDEALVQKVMENQGLRTDGAKTADALMKRSKMLRQQADEDGVEDVTGLFDFGEVVYNDFSYRDRIQNEVLRNG